MWPAKVIGLDDGGIMWFARRDEFRVPPSSEH
jgi:hypothetical protein